MQAAGSSKLDVSYGEYKWFSLKELWDTGYDKKGGMILTALAGPFSNFLLAFIAMVIYTLLGGLRFSSASFGFTLASVFYELAYYMIMINLGLGLFNLIPIPPLDGSKVLTAILLCYIQYSET